MTEKSAFAAPVVAESLVKDMGLTPAQFFRDIDRALGGRPYRIEGQRVLSGTPEKGIEIELRELPPRRLSALMVLPRCAVTIRFSGLDETERQAFLAIFDRAFQRGGG